MQDNLLKITKDLEAFSNEIGLKQERRLELHKIVQRLNRLNVTGNKPIKKTRKNSVKKSV